MIPRSLICLNLFSLLMELHPELFYTSTSYKQVPGRLPEEPAAMVKVYFHSVDKLWVFLLLVIYFLLPKLFLRFIRL